MKLTIYWLGVAVCGVVAASAHHRFGDAASWFVLIGGVAGFISGRNS